MSDAASRSRHMKALTHANAFMRKLHESEWEAVYLAKRRELERDPNWTPYTTELRAREATKARWADRRSETEDLIELVVSMASEPVTASYVSEFSRLEISTVKKYLRRMRECGRLVASKPPRFPYHLLWSAPSQDAE